MGTVVYLPVREVGLARLLERARSQLAIERDRAIGTLHQAVRLLEAIPSSGGGLDLGDVIAAYRQAIDALGTIDPRRPPEGIWVEELALQLERLACMLVAIYGLVQARAEGLTAAAPKMSGEENWLGQGYDETAQEGDGPSIAHDHGAASGPGAPLGTVT
ncbi:MAG: hypothetical protein ACOY3L_00480 [Pseudomonadota bacterium]